MSKKVIGLVLAIAAFAMLLPNLDAAIVRDTLLEENFDGDWDYDDPPSGPYGDWEILERGDDPNGDRADWHPSGGNAEIYWLYEWDDEDRLISPVFDCSDAMYEEIHMRWFTNLSWFGWPNDYTIKVRGSTDGGSDFDEEIWEDDEESFTGIIDTILPWALGESEVAIDFFCEGNSYTINYYDVDRVLVYAQWEEEGGEEVADLEMVDINRPFFEEEGNEPFTPSCKIWNPTSSVIDAQVQCIISENETGSEVYNDVLAAFPLDPGYNDCDGFKDFTPGMNKEYNAWFVVEHPDDPNPNNNDRDRDFVTGGMQVNAVEILSPEDEENFYFAPEATFKEMLEVPAEDVRLHCSIHDMAYHAEVYHDSTEDLLDFEPLEEKNQAFAQAELEDGEYEVRFWATDGKGGVLSDPSYFSKAFTFSGVAEEPTAELTDLQVSGGTVTYSLAGSGQVSIKVYDASGSVVETLVEGTRGAGTHVANWNVAEASSGVYFVKLVTADKTLARKVMVLH